MTDGEAREMARELVRGSIIEDAASQFIAQILKHAHDERIKPLRDRIEALTEQLAAAREDAKAAEEELELQEQEACMMENDYLKLEKERDALAAKLAKAVEALGDLVKDCEADYPPSHGAMKYYAQRTLAELKSQGDGFASQKGEKHV